MSEHTHDHAHDADHDGHDHAHGGDDHGEHVHDDAHYIKIWKGLLVLLAISIIGPLFEIQIVTLITAFGVAGVKAYIVVKYFMHADLELPYVHYFLITSLVFIALFFAGVSPDVMRHSGTNWEHVSTEAWIAEQLAYEESLLEGGGHHGEDPGDAEVH